MIRFKKKMTTYLEPELIKVLDDLRSAKFRGMSRAEAIRLAVRQWVLIQKHSYMWGGNKKGPESLERPRPAPEARGRAE